MTLEFVFQRFVFTLFISCVKLIKGLLFWMAFLHSIHFIIFTLLRQLLFRRKIKKRNFKIKAKTYVKLIDCLEGLSAYDLIIHLFSLIFIWYEFCLWVRLSDAPQLSLMMGTSGTKTGQHISEGDEIFMKCQINANPPILVIQFYFNGTQIDDTIEGIPPFSSKNNFQ